MKYFICQEWKSTKNNHAGMVHLCVKIKEFDPKNINVIVVPFIRGVYVRNAIYFFLSVYLIFKTKVKDEIYLMEYMLPTHNQYLIARLHRLIKKNIKIYGVAHLVPEEMDRFYSTKDKLFKWVGAIDRLITFGSSLSSYFIKRGVPVNQLYTSFHYVDTDYYAKKAAVLKNNNSFNIIVMGNMKRNYDVLYKIIMNNPDLHFTLCIGTMNHIKQLFAVLKNVTLVGFVPENELKKLMDNADISLNVMDDTVGSNVITTSLAMGLAIVTSDVGAIRDYCDDNNAIFCNNNDLESFNRALKFLSANPEVLLRMKKASLERVKNYSVKKFLDSVINLAG
jgi:glycosyltransferase involved in cell wall biosynthesis